MFDDQAGVDVVSWTLSLCGAEESTCQGSVTLMEYIEQIIELHRSGRSVSALAKEFDPVRSQ